MIIIKPMHGSKSYYKSFMGTFHVMLERLYEIQKCSKNVWGEKSNQKAKIREVLFINVSYLYMIRKLYVLCSNLYKFW